MKVCLNRSELRALLLYILLCCVFAVAVNAEERFSSFVDKNIELLHTESKTCEPKKVCRFQIALPSDADSTNKNYEAGIFFGTALLPQAELLAGLDLLHEMRPIGIDKSYRSHASLGEVKEVFLKNDVARIYAKDTGELYIGDEKDARFLSLAPKAAVEGSKISELASYASYLESFKLSARRNKGKLDLTLLSPKRWKKKGALARVAAGTEVTTQGRRESFLSQIILLQQKASDELEEVEIAGAEENPIDPLSEKVDREK